MEIWNLFIFYPSESIPPPIRPPGTDFHDFVRTELIMPKISFHNGQWLVINNKINRTHQPYFHWSHSTLKQGANAGFIHLAFFGFIFTQLWHLGQCTFTDLFDLCKLASRIPMYVHSWLQWWQVKRQLVYWLSIDQNERIECMNSMGRRVKVQSWHAIDWQYCRVCR